MLAGLKSDVDRVLPALSQAARQDPSPRVQTACLMTIAKIASEEEALRELTAALSSGTSVQVRRLAAKRLAAGGPLAAPACPELIQALSDPDEKVVTNVTDALIAIGKPAVEPLVSTLESPQAALRMRALFILGRIGGPAKSALPQIRKRLQDPDTNTKRLAERVVTYLENVPDPVETADPTDP